MMETYKLFIERNLLKLHAMDSGRSRAQQHSGCHDEGVLHPPAKLIDMDWRTEKVKDQTGDSVAACK